MGSSSGPVGLLPRVRHGGAAKGEVTSFHGVAMPADVCLIRSMANAISCLIVMVRLVVFVFLDGLDSLGT